MLPSNPEAPKKHHTVLNGSEMYVTCAIFVFRAENQLTVVASGGLKAYRFIDTNINS